MSTETKTVVLTGSGWARGRREDGSNLLMGGSGVGCCLGWLGEACGVPRALMYGIGDPEECLSQSPSWDIEELSADAKWYLNILGQVGDKAGVSSAIKINDDYERDPDGEDVSLEVSRTDDEKIEALRPIFRGWGWEIEWRPDA